MAGDAGGLGPATLTAPRLGKQARSSPLAHCTRTWKLRPGTLCARREGLTRNPGLVPVPQSRASGTLMRRVSHAKRPSAAHDTSHPGKVEARVQPACMVMLPNRVSIRVEAPPPKPETMEGSAGLTLRVTPHSAPNECGAGGCRRRSPVPPPARSPPVGPANSAAVRSRPATPPRPQTAPRWTP